MTRAERRRAARQQEAAEVRYQLTAKEIREIEKRAVESKKRADSGQNHAGSKRRVETSRGNAFGRR